VEQSVTMFDSWPNNAMQRMALGPCSWIRLFYRARTRLDVSLALFPPSLILSR
jgi:hypothetical protein